MSSFSSVIRKPGAKITPRVAPRRSIVRKTAQTRDDTPPQPERSIGNINVAANAQESAREWQLAGVTAVDGERHVGEPLQQFEDPNISTTQHTVGNAPQKATTVIPVITSSAEPNASPLAAELHTPGWPASKPTLPQHSDSPDPIRSQPVQRALSAADVSVSTAIEQPGVPRVQQSHVLPLDAQRANPPQTPRSRSKRKQQPQGSAQIILAQSSLVTPPPTQPSQSPNRDHQASAPSPRAPSVASQPSEAEEALGRVNTQFQKIGDIAAAIIRSTPAPEASAAETDDDQNASSKPPRKRRKKNNGQSPTVEDQAAGIVDRAIGDKDAASRKRRGATPEEAEEHEIAAETTTMFDVCDDRHKWGKKSEIEKQMAANWPEILARRREDAAERLAKNLAGRRKKDKLQIPDQPSTEVDMGAVPELVIQDGQLVVASRDVDRHATTTNVANQVVEADIREDTDIYKRVNSSTVGPQRTQVAPGQQWDDMSTQLFYQGLKMFGTDFKMISNIIPGKNRRQVKLKYNVEERTNWPKVHRCLSQQQEVTLDSYKSMTGMEFGNVSDVYKQMEDDEKQLREADEARRREEGIISQPAGDTGGQADVPVPSIEVDGEPPIGGEGQPVAGDRQSTAAVSRLGSTTTGRHTVQPPGPGAKKKQGQRKSQSTTKRGRHAVSKNKGAEGIEERLGNVDEVAIPGQ